MHFDLFQALILIALNYACSLRLCNIKFIFLLMTSHQQHPCITAIRSSHGRNLLVPYARTGACIAIHMHMSLFPCTHSILWNEYNSRDPVHWIILDVEI